MLCERCQLCEGEKGLVRRTWRPYVVCHSCSFLVRVITVTSCCESLTDKDSLYFTGRTFSPTSYFENIN